MNKYVLCIKNTFARVVLQSLLAFLNINYKHYLNTVVSIVTANCTTVEVNFSYNVALRVESADPWTLFGKTIFYTDYYQF